MGAVHATVNGRLGYPGTRGIHELVANCCYGAAAPTRCCADEPHGTIHNGSIETTEAPCGLSRAENAAPRLLTPRGAAALAGFRSLLFQNGHPSQSSV